MLKSNEEQPVDFPPTDRRAIERALRLATEDALLAHKRAGLPIAVWKDGRVATVPPELIPVIDPVAEKGSYMHGAHAGNIGDVFKHACLISFFRSASLRLPLRYVESHCGYANYLTDLLRAEHGGWSDERAWSLGPLLEKSWSNAGLSELKNLMERTDFYPGSPELALRYLPDGAELLFCDLQVAALSSIESLPRETSNEHSSVTVRRMDGFECVAKYVQETNNQFQGRTLLFIDPPYDGRQHEGSDWHAVEQLISKAQGQPNISVLVWYPKKIRFANPFPSPVAMSKLRELGAQRAEICFQDAKSGWAEQDLKGCGLLWLNFPEMAESASAVGQELERGFKTGFECLKDNKRRFDLKFTPPETGLDCGQAGTV